MKFKHIIASLSLATVTAFGLAAGLSAKQEAKAVKADDPKTWGFGVVLDASTIPDDWRAQCSNFRFHVWGTGVNETFSMHQVGPSDLYTVNVSFTDAQSVSGGQFIFSQGEDKYSQDASFGYSKSSDFFGYMSWKFSNSWSEGKWALSNQTWSRAQISYYDSEGASHNTEMTYNPLNNCFHFDNFLVNDKNVSKTISVLIGGSWNYTYRAIYNYSAVATGSGDWFMLDEGAYDIYINNEFKVESVSSGGIIEIKKYEGPNSGYIYYVSNSASATTDYIYSWGADEQFGAFPGTAIASVTGVEEMTGNGVIHFQGGDTAKLIYKIPVTIGYPSGDTTFMFNNGSGDYKSEERALVDGAAYWWTGIPNTDAGEAIEFLAFAEDIRNHAEDTSVCNISAANAALIVNGYNALDDSLAATYIDGTTVYTYRRDGESGNELVSYRVVVEQLGKIANITVDGAVSSYRFDILSGSNLSIVIISVATVSALAATLFFVFKKKKQN